MESTAWYHHRPLGLLLQWLVAGCNITGSIYEERVSVLSLKPPLFASPKVLKCQVSFTLTAGWKTARASHHRSCLGVRQLPPWPDGAGHGWGHHLLPWGTPGGWHSPRPPRLHTRAAGATPDEEAGAPLL